MTSPSEAPGGPETAGSPEALGAPEVPGAPEAAPGGPLHGEATRLHPAVMGVWLIQSSLPAIILFFVAPPLALTIVAVSLFFIITRYIRFRWRLEPDALVIDEGLFIRKRRVIRRERIQTVDLERGIPHRLMGVVEVRVEAIGGGGTEGQLDGLPRPMAEELRSILLGNGFVAGRAGAGAGAGAEGEAGSATSPWDTADSGEAADTAAAGARRPAMASAPVETVRTVVPPDRLVVAGLTGGRVGIAAAIVGFLFQSLPDAWWTEGLGFLMTTGPDPTSLVGIRILVVLAVFAVLAGFFLSVVGTVFTHWDFTVSEGPDTLGVRRGLFTEHRDTVPYRRIQAVVVEENLVRRLLGLGLVRVIVAGRAGGSSEEGSDLLLPIGKRAELYDLARDAVGMEEALPEKLNPMPWRARSRRWFRAFLAAAAVTAAVALILHLRELPLAWEWLAITGGAVLLPGLLLGEGAYRSLGWFDSGDFLVVREGVLNRRTSLVRTDRLQVVETTANPFQRLGGLGTLQLRVARPVTGFSPRALDMGEGEAARWREDLGRRVNHLRDPFAAPTPAGAGFGADGSGESGGRPTPVTI
ncbi:MAG: hypothetical protein EA422_07350 [Gemmatimonadales bacterium]|nr:MAG: hypothetical protein EA422_07350 [Gemmatimonadales bacterium]